MKQTLAFAMLVALVLVTVSGTSWADRMYKYTDDKGNIHFVDDYRKIPTKYRDQTEKRHTPSRPAAPAEGAAPEGAGEGATGGGEGQGTPSEFGPKGDVDLSGLPADVDPANVIGRDEKGNFLVDPGRRKRLEEERQREQELQKKRKLGQADNEGHDEAYWRKRTADCLSKLRILDDNYRNAFAAYQQSPKFGDPAEEAKAQKHKQAAESQRTECDRIPQDARAAGAPPGWSR